MSETHTTVRLSDLVEIDRRRGQPADDQLYVGLEHIAPETGLITPVTVGEAGVRSSTFEFDEGCVLYGKLRPYLRKVALPTFAGVCSTDILPLRPKEGVDRRLVAAILRTPEFTEAVGNLVTGASLPRIAPDVLLSMEVKIPTSQAQRQAVVAAVDLLESATREMRRLSDALEGLRNLPGSLLAAERVNLAGL